MLPAVEELALSGDAEAHAFPVPLKNSRDKANLLAASGSKKERNLTPTAHARDGFVVPSQRSSGIIGCVSFLFASTAV